MNPALFASASSTFISLKLPAERGRKTGLFTTSTFDSSQQELVTASFKTAWGTTDTSLTVKSTLFQQHMKIFCLIDFITFFFKWSFRGIKLQNKLKMM